MRVYYVAMGADEVFAPGVKTWVTADRRAWVDFMLLCAHMRGTVGTRYWTVFSSVEVRW